MKGTVMIRRLLNELPTLAVTFATIVGLTNSDAQLWQEIAVAASAIGTWLVVRQSTDGPVTLYEHRHATFLHEHDGILHGHPHDEGPHDH